MNVLSQIVVAPLVGPFHTRFPRYNAFDVRDALRAAGVEALALAPLAPGALEGQEWRGTDEIALPLAVVPWALRAGIALHEVGSFAGGEGEPGEAGAEREFEELLSRFEAGQERLRRVRQAEEPIERLLASPLDLRRVRSELMPAVEAYHGVRAAEFGEGPGTGWAQARAAVMAERVLALPHRRVALLAGVDDLVNLLPALSGHVELEQLTLAPEPSEEARGRALLDAAMRGEVEEPAGLLAALRELGTPEAGYLEANILLEHSHLAEALEVLQRVLRTDFQEPYYLPGFMLARLGQVYDLAGRRADALRSYRGVLALSYSPAEAIEAAKAGMETPFGAELDGAAEGTDGPSDDHGG
ncbi:MAG TPA: hypothetical protein VFN07_07260 [Trueperaceae bacterium]|nr:hypothetical protein [Trueperaceae bacterium]